MIHNLNNLKSLQDAYTPKMISSPILLTTKYFMNKINNGFWLVIKWERDSYNGLRCKNRVQALGSGPTARNVISNVDSYI